MLNINDKVLVNEIASAPREGVITDMFTMFGVTVYEVTTDIGPILEDAHNLMSCNELNEHYDALAAQRAEQEDDMFYAEQFPLSNNFY